MYNFLDPKLMPKVTTSSPATDNYEATNLINENEAIRARGYLAYTVIKPPVELEFEFLCAVNISYICLHTTIGQQKCTGIEVFVKNNSIPWTSIGKGFYDKPGVTFCTSRKYSKSNLPPFHDLSNELLYFKSDQFRIFTDAFFLKILIFRTHRSVPCLGSIKVYGNPSRSCSQVTVNTINRIMGQISKSMVPLKLNSEKSESKIPEDFIDDLTCEIMTIPMTLPSGKSVDRDTLEKHIENEKSFGRKPGDPFTGLTFTETRKPVMNVALKSRIDMFLMQNSNNSFTFGLKRTVGSDMENRCKRSKFNECCVCQRKEHLYVIPCEHHYCRDCLVAVKTWECNSCGKDFSRGDASRYHN